MATRVWISLVVGTVLAALPIGALSQNGSGEARKLSELRPLVTEPSIHLRVSVSDPKYSLSAVHVWVNNVPVYGLRGHPLPSNSGKWSGEIPVFDLARGLNKIEIAAQNAAGVLSLRLPRYITYRPPDTTKLGKPDLYVVSVGVSAYKEMRYKLRYAASDAQRIYRQLVTAPTNVQRFRNLTHEGLEPLTENRATRGNINAVKSILMRSNPDDTVILFLSGHGKVQGSGFYFGTWDIDFADPSKAGLSYDDILNLLDGIPARYRLVLLDTCYSGPVAAKPAARTDRPGTGVRLTSMQTPPSASDADYVHPKSADVNQVEQSPLALPEGFALMQQMFADLDRGEGAEVIAAASGYEEAFERGQILSGTFAKALSEAFDDPARAKTEKERDTPGLTVPQLSSYVNRRVLELTKNRQTPTPRQENIEQHAWRVL